MIRRWHISLSAGFVAAALLAAAWRLYSRRPRERIPGQEGLDDPDVAEGFNRVASMPQMRLLRWFVARRATGMVSDGEAADLGCGPGYLVTEMALKAPGLHVTGIDLSEEMLAEASAWSQDHGVEGRVSFKKGDVQKLPLPDDSADLVVSTLSLHHWGRPVAVLDEIARVLRPGGSFLIFDLRRDVSAPVWLLMWFVTRCIVPRALRRVNEPLASRDAAYAPHEVAGLAAQSKISNWRVNTSPLWLTIEGTTAGPEAEPQRP